MHIFLFIMQPCLTYRLYLALAPSKHTLYDLVFEIGNLWVKELKLLCIRILTLKVLWVGFKTTIKLCSGAPTKYH